MRLRRGKAKVVDGVRRTGRDGKIDKTNQPQISSSLQLAWRMTGGGEGVASVLYPRLCVYVHIFMPVI